MSLDLLGADCLGAYDIAPKQRFLNAIKKVPVAMARTLVNNALNVTTTTLEMAKRGVSFDISKSLLPSVQSELPGINSLKKTQEQLQRHAEALSRFSDPAAIYPDLVDLKKWVMQAWIDANAVEEGRAMQERAWEQMKEEIKRELKQFPNALVEELTGVPIWMWAVGGLAALGIVGAGYYAGRRFIFGRD